MEKLIKKLDEIFAEYGVAEDDVAEVGALIAGIGGDEFVADGEDFVAPEMAEVTDEAAEEAIED
jgi:hypothetical protein